MAVKRVQKRLLGLVSELFSTLQHLSHRNVSSLSLLYPPTQTFAAKTHLAMYTVANHPRSPRKVLW